MFPPVSVGPVVAPTAMGPLFHLTTAVELDAHTRDGAYAPPSLAAEGFIHLSRLEQVPGTIARFFAGRDDLLLLELAARGLPVRHDAVPGGETFPHLYGPLPVRAIHARHALGPGAPLPASLELLGRLLGAHAWYEHPEGPLFVETHRDVQRTCGHWLFTAGAVSAWHQVLDSDELWLLHAGRLRVHVLGEDRVVRTEVLGLGPGERAVLSVPAGRWQAAELPSGEPLAFGSNVCAPPFSFESSFRLGRRSELAAQHPELGPWLERLSVDR